MRIAVVGAGAWGTTMASVAATRADVRLWALEAAVVDDVNTNHRNEHYLPDVTLPPGLAATGDLTEVIVGAEAVLVAVPAQHFRSVLSAPQQGSNLRFRC